MAPADLDKSLSRYRCVFTWAISAARGLMSHPQKSFPLRFASTAVVPHPQNTSATLRTVTPLASACCSAFVVMNAGNFAGYGWILWINSSLLSPKSHEATPVPVPSHLGLPPFPRSRRGSRRHPGCCHRTTTASDPPSSIAPFYFPTVRRIHSCPAFRPSELLTLRYHAVLVALYLGLIRPRGVPPAISPFSLASGRFHGFPCLQRQPFGNWHPARITQWRKFIPRHSQPCLPFGWAILYGVRAVVLRFEPCFESRPYGLPSLSSGATARPSPSGHRPTRRRCLDPVAALPSHR